jgi:PAS domain S-box-containing protein
MVDKIMETEVFLELIFSANNESNEQLILKKSISKYLRKLNCFLAGVLKETETGLVEISLIPYSERNSQEWQEVKSYFKNRYPETDKRNCILQRNELYYYSFNISTYGKLILGRKNAFNETFRNELKPVVNHLGKVLLQAIEIEQRKKAEKELLQEQKRLRILIDNLPDPIYVKDNLARKIIANPADVEHLGASNEAEIIGKTDLELWPGKEGIKNYQRDLEILNTGIPIIKKEVCFQNMDNELKWVLRTIIPTFDKQGETTGLVGIAQDITERKENEQKLKNALAKAEESDRLKSAFLANMSHEIRTPMNGILGFTSLLKEPGLTGEDQQKFIDIIEKSGDRMLNTINDIINISKIEAGQVDVKISDINLNKQLDEFFEFFLPEAKKKNIKLSVTSKVPNQLTNFKSDKEKLNSILTNFIKNAIKYTHAGSIDFGFSIIDKGKQNELEFYVNDTGMGIPKERQEAVFGRFVQADIEDKQVYEGSGLGLAISKAYVEMLGGKIWMESEEGVGSQFYFTIPYNTDNKEIRERAIEESNKQLSIKKELKILITDDDEFVLTYLSIVLEEYSKEMLIAKTGIEAVEMCRDNPDIDLVLMDIKIPGINGYEATRQIREFNKEVFILAQTAYAQSGDRERSIKAGCDDYISKPINKEKLLRIISTQL